jgi:hypothetical protein
VKSLESNCSGSREVCVSDERRFVAAFSATLAEYILAGLSF